jgi:RHS repeat-associated protein
MVYDKRDRLVLTQDGNQRQDNQWTFTKYDALNRPVLTGTKTISGSRDAVQAAVNDFYEQSNPMYETRSGNWNTGDHGYTDLSYPKGISEYSYLTATYYDDYGFHGGEPAYVLITGDDIDIGEHLPKPKGQATGAKVKVLGDNEFLKSSTYYDNKYRVILTRAGQYNGDHQQLLLSKAITEEGYIYIYVSNESNLNVNVYFDDLKITHIAADMVVQANDYYPFGLTMKPSDFQRDGEQGNKFLYNGKELQTDLDLDWYDYGRRMYDPALGRFHVVDRFAEKYYPVSPYQYAANNPINVIDVNGDSLWISFGDNRVLYQDGQLLNSDGSQYSGKGVRINKKGEQIITDSFLSSAVSALGVIGGTETGAGVISALQGSDYNFTIKSGNDRFMPGDGKKGALYANWMNNAQAARVLGEGKPIVEGLPFNSIGSGGFIYWNPSGSNEMITDKGTRYSNPNMALAHEMFHAFDASTGQLDTRYVSFNGGIENVSEIRAVYFANKVRGEWVNNKGNRVIKHYRSQYSSGGASLLKDGMPINIEAPKLLAKLPF